MRGPMHYAIVNGRECIVYDREDMRAAMENPPVYCPVCAEKEPHTCESAPVSVAPITLPDGIEKAPQKRTDGPAQEPKA
jgi:hypothetical protein